MAGLEKIQWDSSLPFGQAALKFCLPWASISLVNGRMSYHQSLVYICVMIVSFPTKAAKGKAKMAVHLKSHGLSSQWISNYHETMSDNHHFIDLQGTRNHEIQTMLLRITHNSPSQT